MRLSLVIFHVVVFKTFEQSKANDFNSDIAGRITSPQAYVVVSSV